MPAIKCLAVGLKRVFHTPSLILWLYIALIALAFPLAAAMRSVLRGAIGDSLVQQNLRQGFDLDWYGEFAAKHAGLAGSFGPGVVGILPMMGNLEKVVDGTLFETDGTVLAVGVLFLLVWAFFGGGVIYRYANPENDFSRPILFAESARFFCRFVRLLIVSVALYWAVAHWLAGELFRWMEEATRDVTAERTVMLYTALIYALILLVLVLLGVVFDYAKIALVCENRSSAILALVRGFRFVLAHPVKCSGIYLALLLAGGIWLAAFSLIAPGPNQSTTLAVILTFGLGQLFLLGRLILKLWFLSGQTLLFESSSKAST